MGPGERAVEFIRKYLRHVKGEWAGMPFELDPWQDKIIRKLFGTLRADGTRQYRRCYVEIPRKNGKSTLASAVALYLLLADKEPGAEIYSCAADRDQAGIVFDMARSMVESHVELRKRTKVYRTSIVVPETASRYKVLSADAFTKHGLNAHGVIFDELHAQKNRDLWDVMLTSTGARRQPLIFSITTAGVYNPESICWEVHDYACKVRDGIIEDDEFLPVIYAADKDDDWTDPEIWKASNPGFGISVKADYLERECERAKEVPAAQNTFRRLHLNQWTEQETRWLDMDVWDESGGVLDEDALAGQECFAGLDLSTTTDISALALYFRGGETVMRFWVPGDNIAKRAKHDRVPYDTWKRDGHLISTDGNVVDYDFIRKEINELGRVYNIRQIAIDRWNATHLSTQLMGDGHDVVMFGQGFASMSAPTKELEKLLLNRAINHGNHPVLRWMASNVAVKQDAAGNLKPAKDKSTERIDGIVALIMAIGLATQDDGESLSERYEKDDILVLN